jgi:hypothetical protein
VPSLRSNIIEKMTVESLPHYALEMITGKLLGDGNITIEAGKKGRIRFSHTANDKEWCFHCYNELKTHFRLSTPKYRKIKDKRTGLEYTQYYVQSKTSNEIEYLKACWYKNGRKRLPKGILCTALSSLCLAWWYQDDGHLKKKNHIPKKIILSTDSFSEEECTFLKRALFYRFRLRFHLDGQNRLILYNKPSIYYFLILVRPYIIQGMKRKDLEQKLVGISDFPTSKRTTLSLPSFIKIEQPTKQIQNTLKELPYILKFSQNKNGYQRLFNTWATHSELWNKQRVSYQIKIDQESLYHLELLHTKTGFQKSECAAFCFLKDKVLEEKKRPPIIDPTTLGNGFEVD